MAVLAEVHAAHAFARAGGGTRRPGLRLRPRPAGAARGLHRGRRPTAPLVARAAAEHGDRAGHPRRPRHDRRRAAPDGGDGLLSAAQIESWSTRIAARQRRHERHQPGPGRGLPGQLHAATTRWAATTGRSCWHGCCSCSPRGSRRSTTWGCSPAATSPCPRHRRAGDQPAPLHRRGGRRRAGAAGRASRCRELLRLRTEHPAFGGEFTASGTAGELVLGWRHGDATAELRADLARTSWRVAFSGAGAARTVTDADLDGRG